MYKMKDLNREKIIGIFNELLLSKLSISYYPEPVSYITDKVKVILVLSNQKSLCNQKRIITCHRR